MRLVPVRILIPAVLTSRCDDFGVAVCQSYAAGMKEWSKGLALEGREPIHNKPSVQALGRLCECAVCLYFKIGCDVLDWSDTCDVGHDLMIGGVTIDVKGSSHPGAYRLIWPISKIEFMDKMADVLLFARLETNLPRPGSVVLEGWTTKEIFLRDHKRADPREPLDTGTPYMARKDLIDMTVLKGFL